MLAYGLYNLPEVQRQAVGATRNFSNRATSPYGDIRAQALATQLGRQLQYSRMARQDRLNALQHNINMSGLRNQFDILKLRRRDLRGNKSMFPWSIGLGLATTGLNAWQKYNQSQERKKQLTKYEKELANLRSMYPILRGGYK